MAVSIDTGDEVELHPENKKTYGKDFVGYGPRFSGHEV